MGADMLLAAEACEETSCPACGTNPNRYKTKPKQPTSDVSSSSMLRNPVITRADPSKKGPAPVRTCSCQTPRTSRHALAIPNRLVEKELSCTPPQLMQPTDMALCLDGLGGAFILVQNLRVDLSTRNIQLEGSRLAALEPLCTPEKTHAANEYLHVWIDFIGQCWRCSCFKDCQLQATCLKAWLGTN